jgi:hypothetical protein
MRLIQTQTLVLAHVTSSGVCGGTIFMSWTGALMQQHIKECDLE